MEVQQPPTKIPRLSESEEEHERLIELLEERLARHDENRKAAQDKLHEICDGLRTQIDELEDRVNKELEEKFTSEDNRLQAALNELRGNSTASAIQKAKAELLTFQSYEVIENKEEEEDDDDDDKEEYECEEEEYDDDDDEDDEEDDEEEGEEEEEEDNGDNENDDETHENDTVKPNFDLTTLYKLKTERRIAPELTEMRKPTNVCVAGVDRGRVCVQFTCFNPDEERVLSDHTIVNPVKCKCLLFKKDNEQESKEEYPLDENEDKDSFLFTFTPDILEAETSYEIRVKMVVGDRESEWSDEVAEFTTPEFKECCVWKKCPDYVDNNRKYSVDEKNPRVATKVNDNSYCTIIGNTHIPLNKETLWNIKIHKSNNNDGNSIFIGVAPNDINQNAGYNADKCGWYFYCYYSTLCSGPPHKYRGNEYGPMKVYGQYVHTGDSVGVVIDTTRGELSFVLNGVNRGVAYEGIPLDEPLVPCVLLCNNGDSVELDTSEVKENVDSSIPVLSNIKTKSITWESITLTWDNVADASSYQIEVDESKSWDVSTTNAFTKRRLLPETEHSFRVRTMRGSSVSEWSSVVKGRTLKAPEFPECVWKECPDDVDDFSKYSVDERNPRVATKINGYGCDCTIIGNTQIPPNTVTTWNVKVLRSEDNNGRNICIGIAPFDINQSVDNDNYDGCGWYFDCYKSVLRSGPPQYYGYPGKPYGPKKGGGQYVHTGDSVGVVVDTAKGDLSFIVGNVNHGVAYEGIPLDKPLVPCVILKYQGDSVELIA